MVNPLFTHPDLPEEEMPSPEDQGGQPTERLLAGKYKTVDELERGYQNLFAEGQRLLERVKAQEEPAPSAWGDEADRVRPADMRAARQDPVDALSMAGIPVDALRELVKKEVFQEISPVFRGAQARQNVVEEYPEFPKFEGELAQFVEANPQLKARYNRAYQADEEMALRWVYGEFIKTRGEPRGSASGEAQASARLDASLPGRVSPKRTAPGDFDTELYDKLREEAYRTGNWSKALAYKLQGTIPEGHYAPLG